MLKHNVDEIKRDLMLSRMFSDVANLLAKTQEIRALLEASTIGSEIINGEMEKYVHMLKQQPIYRIAIHDRTGEVNTDCYDLLENFAPELKMSYHNINDMPKWAQEKLAVLMVLDPTKINNDIEGVGKRINRNTYWLYKENASGDDAREKS